MLIEAVWWAAFSESFVRLMMFLMISFCCRRCSLLLHHIGRLYSHFNPKCLQALQLGLPSSHFFRRNLHVKQPVLQLSATVLVANPCKSVRNNPPVRDRRCILEGVCLEAADAVGAAMFAPALLEGGVFDEDIG